MWSHTADVVEPVVVGGARDRCQLGGPAVRSQSATNISLCAWIGSCMP